MSTSAPWGTSRGLRLVQREGPSIGSPEESLFWNGVFQLRKQVSDLQKYLEKNRFTDVELESFTATQTVLEAVFLELRQNDGIGFEALSRRHNYDPRHAKKFPLLLSCDAESSDCYRVGVLSGQRGAPVLFVLQVDLSCSCRSCDKWCYVEEMEIDIINSKREYPMAHKVKKILNEIDGLIRAGKGTRAASQLRELGAQRIPAACRAKFAHLASRTHQYAYVIRLLRPFVRPFGDWRLGGRRAEQEEYASALIQVGAIAEGIDILANIKQISPQGLLYKAFGHVAVWDYGSSIPLLEQYCSSPAVSHYERLTGRVNLAAALVFERNPEALKVIDEIIRETEEFVRLRGHAYHLKAQWMIAKHDFTRARFFIKKARKAYQGIGGFDSLFADKSDVLTNVLETKGSRQSLEALKQFQQKAEKLNHWETVRDCDLYRAISTQDKDLVVHVYVGSPFQGYRNRIVSEYGNHFEIPNPYFWAQGEKTAANKKSGLLIDGKASNGERLKLGQLRHRSLLVLASDFYKPFNKARLHSLLFPNEVYNPISSAARIHETMRRTRMWLDKNAVPLKIKELSGNYSLEIGRNYTFIVPLRDVTATRMDFLLETTEKHFVDQPFTASQAKEITGVSLQTMCRALEKGVKKGLVHCTGRKSTSRFQFFNAQNKMLKAS